MKTFVRQDGRALAVVAGFRDRVLNYRPAVTPRDDWAPPQYAASAEKKRRRAERMIRKLERWAGPLKGQRILDVGCGDGANCLVIAGLGVREMAGVDLELKLEQPGEMGDRTRRLAAAILGCETVANLPGTLDRLPLRLLQMNATHLDFPASSFDIVYTRSAMEHIRPVEPALAEMNRVVRTGGLLHLVIDPFYWVRGCHKRGVVDIPWAHARLSLEDYQRFVSETESPGNATRRVERLETLNRLTVTQWRRLIEAQGCELLAWEESSSELGSEMLAAHPEVLETVLPGVQRTDLLCERIEIWLRRN